MSISDSINVFIFTLVFGLYSSMLFLKFKNIWPCVFLHAYCNLLGPPQSLSVIKDKKIKIYFRLILSAGILLFLTLILFII